MTVLSAALLALYLLRPVGDVDIQLQNLRVSGTRFTLPTPAADGDVQLASGAGSDSTILVLDELAMKEFVAFGLRSARIPAGLFLYG